VSIPLFSAFVTLLCLIALLHCLHSHFLDHHHSADPVIESFPVLHHEAQRPPNPAGRVHQERRGEKGVLKVVDVLLVSFCFYYECKRERERVVLYILCVFISFFLDVLLRNLFRRLTLRLGIIHHLCGLFVTEFQMNVKSQQLSSAVDSNANLASPIKLPGANYPMSPRGHQVSSPRGPPRANSNQSQQFNGGEKEKAATQQQQQQSNSSHSQQSSSVSNPPSQAQQSQPQSNLQRTPSAHARFRSSAGGSHSKANLGSNSSAVSFSGSTNSSQANTPMQSPSHSLAASRRKGPLPV
jgi:hypothetical protein